MRSARARERRDERGQVLAARCSCAARSVATGSIQRVRQIANRPFSVMYAAMPRKTKTTTDFRLPPPTRTSVLLPQPEPSVMPTPKRNPPRMYESQVTFGRV